MAQCATFSSLSVSAVELSSIIGGATWAGNTENTIPDFLEGRCLPTPQYCISNKHCQRGRSPCISLSISWTTQTDIKLDSKKFLHTVYADKQTHTGEISLTEVTCNLNTWKSKNTANYGKKMRSNWFLNTLSLEQFLGAVMFLLQVTASLLEAVFCK